MEKHASVEDYIKSAPKEIQSRLKSLRALVMKEVPDAVESISYGMPGYKLNGKPLIYFAGYEHHVGLYATPQGHEAFAKELAKYKQGKGSVQFPNDQPLPMELIRSIVKFRKESLSTPAKKKKAK